MAKSQNDEKVLLLTEKIAVQKTRLNKTEKFNPKTHCALVLFGQTYNLHTLNKQTCVLLIAHVRSLFLAWSTLDLGRDPLVISDFQASIWLDDLISKYEILNIKEEATRLKGLELQLETLLSHDTRVELELTKLEGQI